MAERIANAVQHGYSDFTIDDVLQDLDCDFDIKVYHGSARQRDQQAQGRAFRSYCHHRADSRVDSRYPVAKMTNLSEIADEFVLNSEQHFNETVQTENASEIPQQSVNLITENEILANTIFGLFVNLSRRIEDDYHRKFRSGRKIIDSKLRRMIQEKKQSLGIKDDLTQNFY